MWRCEVSKFLNVIMCHRDICCGTYSRCEGSFWGFITHQIATLFLTLCSIHIQQLFHYLGYRLILYGSHNNVSRKSCSWNRLCLFYVLDKRSFQQTGVRAKNRDRLAQCGYLSPYHTPGERTIWYKSPNALISLIWIQPPACQWKLPDFFETVIKSCIDGDDQMAPNMLIKTMSLSVPDFSKKPIFFLFAALWI